MAGERATISRNGKDWLTPTEQAILNVLADGGEHTPDEIYQCCPGNGFGPSMHNTINVHLTMLRHYLRPRGQDIASILMGGRTTYQLRRLFSSGNTGRQ